MACNPELSRLITEAIGDGWKSDAGGLKKLLDFRQDREFLKKLRTVKMQNKQLLAGWIKKHR
jgi:starch phosphorylase